MTVADAAAPAAPAGPSLLRRLLRHRLFLTGSILFGLMLLMAVFADLIQAAAPERMHYRFRFQNPSWQFRSAPTILAATCGAGWCTAPACR